MRTGANDQGIGDHPKTVVEIACDIRLREVLGLEDGDEIELELPME